MPVQSVSAASPLGPSPLLAHRAYAFPLSETGSPCPYRTPPADRTSPHNSTTASCSLRSNHAARSAPTTGSSHRLSLRSSKVSRRALPASRAHWCPTAPAPQNACGVVAKHAPASPSPAGRATACLASRNGPKAASTAAPSPYSPQSHVWSASTRPPRSVQNLDKHPPTTASQLPSRSPLGSAASMVFHAIRGSPL